MDLTSDVIASIHFVHSFTLEVLLLIAEEQWRDFWLTFLPLFEGFFFIFFILKLILVVTTLSRAKTNISIC